MIQRRRHAYDNDVRFAESAPRKAPWTQCVISHWRRRAHVVSRLKELADRSQRNIRSVLVSEEEQDRVRRIRVLWSINGLAFEATPAAIERLAELPGVRWVLRDRATAHPDVGTPAGPRPTGAEGSGPTGGDVSGPNPNATVAPEVIAHGAKQVWDDLGYTGAGVIVAVIDTGFDRTHPDLADHVWTNLGEVAGNGLDDDGNGHVDDTWGWDFCANAQPVVGTHGTQVAGQVGHVGEVVHATPIHPCSHLPGAIRPLAGGPRQARFRGLRRRQAGPGARRG